MTQQDGFGMDMSGRNSNPRGGGGRNNNPRGGGGGGKTAVTANEVWSRAARRMQNSSFVLPIFVAFITLAIGSIVLTVEDVYTTYRGYEMLETSQGFSFTSVVVSLMLWAGQIAAMYVFVSLRDDADFQRYAKWAIIAFLICMVLDVYTDMVFRVGILVPTSKVVTVAFLQSFGIFTVGSEIASVVGVGMTMQLFPYAWAEVWTIAHRTSTQVNRIRDELDE